MNLLIYLSTNLEPFLIQFCLIIFILVTIFSWINIALYNNELIRFFSQKAMILCCFCMTCLLISRWVLSDHLPLSNLYESSLFLVWSLTLVYILLNNKVNTDWLNIIIIPNVLITYTFATLGLPRAMQESTVLVPALQANWLVMHVSMMILSYGALLFGSLLSITLLTLTYEEFFSKSSLVLMKKNSKSLIYELSTNPNLINCEKIYFEKYKNELVNQIDYWSYRIIGFGFPLLTLGILSGAVWANEAWGSYWSWDPKETWAFITWLIFAIYLHVRITKGWSAEKSALVASLGFCVVWICYLGVNLLGKGLHSYGWLS